MTTYAAERARDIAEARSLKEQEHDRKVSMARRAWEAGEMSNEEISRVVRVDPRTLKRWITEWRKEEAL